MLKLLIAAKDAKIDNVTIGPGFDLAKLAGDGLSVHLGFALADKQVGEF